MAHKRDYDLGIIGGGPAGLAAAMNASYEGIRTILLDGEELGGQAKASPLIENFPGFPKGVSGKKLMQNFVRQARKLGADLQCQRLVHSIRTDGNHHIILMADGEELVTRTLLIATGLHYTPLEADGVSTLLGHGTWYGNAPIRSGRQCVGVVGGANSAAQAAIRASKRAGCTVQLFVRGESLSSTMSDKLIREIHETPNIHLHFRTQVLEARGEERLESVLLAKDGEEMELDLDLLEIFIGAKPQSIWLDGMVAKDKKGFIFTDVDLGDRWTLKDRPPLHLETSVPGIFAAGDIRVSDVKRIVAAAGEGGQIAPMVYRYLHMQK